MKKKKLLILLCSGCLLLVLAALPFMSACAPTPPKPPPPPKAKIEYGPEWDKIVEAAKQEGEINAYGYGFTGERGTWIDETFGVRYGIKINPVSALSAQLYERVKTEQVTGQIVGDMVNIVPRWTAQMYIEGLLEESASRLPELAATTADDWQLPMVYGEGHFLGASGTQMGPMYNYQLVPPAEAPKSYMDLLDPKWDGKVVVISPTIGGTAYRLYMAMPKMGIDRDDFFTRLGKNNPVIEASIFAARDRVVAGDYPIMLMGSIQLAGEGLEGGAPVTMAPVKEGYLWQPGACYCMTKGAPHPNATLVFMNWALTEEGQAAIGKGYRDLQPRVGVGPFYYPYSTPDKMPPLWFLTLDEDLETVQLQGTGLLEKLMGVPVPK